MKHACSAPLLIAALALSGVAHAQSSAANVAQAEKLFDEAKALLESGRAADACTRFNESERLDPQLGTLLNLALCNEQIGKTASAWAEFNEVVGLATRAGQTKRVELAKKHALSLEGSLSRARIDVSRAPADVALQLDGDPVVVTQGLRVPLDPGEHVLVASAPKRTAATVRFDVPRVPSEITVTVPALAVAAPVASGNAASPVRAEAASPSTPWKTIGFITGGVGAGALAFGLVAGGVALGKSNTASSDCPRVACDTSAGYDANQSAHTWATVSTVSVVAGVALIALGAVMILLLPDRDAPRAATIDVQRFDLRF